MAKLWLRYSSVLMDKIHGESPEQDMALDWQADDRTIQIVIARNGESIAATGDYNVSDETIQWLGQFQTEEPSEAVDMEMIPLFNQLSDSCEGILKLAKQEARDVETFQYAFVSARPGGTEEWSLDGSTWHRIPRASVGSWWKKSTGLLTMDMFSRKAFQSLVKEEKPLLAMEHLWDAYRSEDNRGRWMLAATAAELAIKEVLAREVANLSVYIIEAQAPSIDVMYGRIMEHYFGYASPWKKHLQLGMQIRNRLVHRAEFSLSISETDLLMYLACVRDAIWDLLHVARAHKHQGSVMHLNPDKKDYDAWKKRMQDAFDL